MVLLYFPQVTQSMINFNYIYNTVIDVKINLVEQDDESEKL